MSRKDTTRIVIHCAATDRDWHGEVPIDEIRRWHVDERGWRDVGYHLYIRRSGAVELGRDFGAVGAHAQGYNSDSFSICLEGGARVIKNDQGEFSRLVSRNDFTPEQMISLRAMVASALMKYPNIHPVRGVMGHRDLPGVAKDCPSFDVQEWWSREMPDFLKTEHPLGRPLD